MLSKLHFILNNKKDIWKIAAIFVGSLLAAVSEIISISSIPLFVTLLIDPELIQTKLSDYIDISFLLDLESKQLVLFGGILLSAIFIIKNLFLMILIFFQSKVIRDLNVKLTDRLYKLYLYAPYFIHLKKNNAVLVRNIIGETSQVISIILKVVTLFREFLVLIFIFILVLYVNVFITLIIFSILSTSAAIFFYITRNTIHKNAKRMQDLSASRIKSINETFGAIKEVKIFNIEKIFNKKFFSMNLLREHYYFVNSVLTSIPRYFLETIIVLTLIFVLLLYNYLEKDFVSLLPLLTLLTVAAVRLLPSFNSISQSLSSIKSLSPSLNLVINDIQNLQKVKNEKKF